MKTKFLRTFILPCLMLCNLTVIKADGPTIPVITIPSNNNNGSHHNAPIHQDFYAVYNRLDQTLYINVYSSITISNVTINQDGTPIISDNIPTFYYLLSSYGSGEYTVLLTTENGITYTGTFTIN